MIAELTKKDLDMCREDSWASLCPDDPEAVTTEEMEDAVVDLVGRFARTFG